jgi:NAD(P)-dependent dehydrogenase (short-subunit alcohol dehydrogenase family)
MIDLTNKVAIVTGAASGMGEATANTLAAHGAKVVIADINVDGGSENAEKITASGGHAISIPTDVSQEAQVIALMDETRRVFGRLDILHNSAAAMEAAGRDPNVVEVTAELWEETMATDIRGPLWCCKHAIPFMLETGGGSIINTSSISGQVGETGLTAYAAAKAALSQLTRSVAAQWGKQGMRCNAIAPGLVLTPSGDLLPPELKALYLRQTLTPYLGQASDIANLLVFLASDEARYITAQTINIDGGLVSHNGFVPDIVEWMESQPSGFEHAAYSGRARS